MHFSGLGYLPLLAIIALVFLRRLRFTSSVAAGALLALSFAPYVYYDLKHGLPNFHSLMDLAGAPWTLSWDHWVYPIQLMGNLEYRHWLGLPALDFIGAAWRD